MVGGAESAGKFCVIFLPVLSIKTSRSLAGAPVRMFILSRKLVFEARAGAPLLVALIQPQPIGTNPSIVVLLVGVELVGEMRPVILFAVALLPLSRHDSVSLQSD